MISFDNIAKKLASKGARILYSHVITNDTQWDDVISHLQTFASWKNVAESIGLKVTVVHKDDRKGNVGAAICTTCTDEQYALMVIIKD